ncbi:hypothetical protein L195_g023892 [Trifolium pratense]|uniref:Uncharacterized protein n=1 Tax=Trifolium pratense TaxID=57577 RepID=A0A2K3NC29_TRIPR|nr:hypothetical protein L195_g023892 [Trifolium pratense]
MDEKKDKNWFTRLDYSGIFFFELASKARSSELVYCVFYMDKPLLLWAGWPSFCFDEWIDHELTVPCRKHSLIVHSPKIILFT